MEDRILLDVKDLQVSFFTPAGEVKAVNGITYKLKYGEVMGIVGESGSGKSVEAILLLVSCKVQDEWLVEAYFLIRKTCWNIMKIRCRNLEEIK